MWYGVPWYGVANSLIRRDLHRARQASSTGRASLDNTTTAPLQLLDHARISDKRAAACIHASHCTISCRTYLAGETPPQGPHAVRPAARDSWCLRDVAVALKGGRRRDVVSAVRLELGVGVVRLKGRVLQFQLGLDTLRITRMYTEKQNTKTDTAIVRRYLAHVSFWLG